MAGQLPDSWRVAGCKLRRVQNDATASMRLLTPARQFVVGGTNGAVCLHQYIECVTAIKKNMKAMIHCVFQPAAMKVQWPNESQLHEPGELAIL